MKKPTIHIRQIFYDAASRAALDRGFIPYDNTATERPDWYEFWPMWKFFKSNELDDNAWYGFVSPKFGPKTGFSSTRVKQILSEIHDTHEVALFTSTWDFIAYFQNAFEQGEVWHEGMTEVAQEFYRLIGYPVDIANLVNYSGNSVTSNYVIAKPRYWRRWCEFGDRLMLIAHANTEFGARLRGDTTYGPKRIAFKVFLQERLHSVILAKEKFAVYVPDEIKDRNLFDPLFYASPEMKRTLQTCDLLKEYYCRTGDLQFLDTYKKIKAGIPKKPTRFR